MIQNEREIRHEYVLQAVRQMMTAARTAPKGKGIDIIEVAMVTDEDIKRLSEELVIMSGETGLKFFLRDADNILQAEAIMIAGTRQQVQGLNCAHSGFRLVWRSRKPSLVRLIRWTWALRSVRLVPRRRICAWIHV